MIPITIHAESPSHHPSAPATVSAPAFGAVASHTNADYQTNDYRTKGLPRV